MAAPDTAPAKQKLPPALKPNSLKPADYERGNYFAIVPSETTFDEVMTPAFWQHHSRTLSGGPTLRPFARVELVREDGTMDLLLRVLECKPGMVRMRCLRKFVSDENLGKPGRGSQESLPGDENLTLPPGYQWTYVPRGANRGHMVRLATGDVLVQAKATKAEAVAVAQAHFNEANRVPADV